MLTTGAGEEAAWLESMRYLKAAETAPADERPETRLLLNPAGTVWDLPLALKALQRSHFVIVPTQPSLPDARDAMKTVAQIDDAEDLAKTPIPRALVWTRFLPGFESLVARHVRQSLEGEDVPILKTAVMERAAFRAIHLTGKVPRQTEPKGQAAGNIAALTQEVLEHLQVKEEA